LATALAVGLPLIAQDDTTGTDIDTAIPIWFGEDVFDTLDSVLRQRLVYKIDLARGQKFSVTANLTGVTPVRDWNVCLFSPTTRSVANFTFQRNCRGSALASDGFGDTALTFDYEVPVAGTYFIVMQAFDPSHKFRLRVTAQGTPLVTALPAQAGCVLGPVDSISYSLRLIAMNLPDEVSIGGTKLCASCAVKAPVYSHIVSKLEFAMQGNLSVEACHDAAGQVFQVKLQRP